MIDESFEYVYFIRTAIPIGDALKRFVETYNAWLDLDLKLISRTLDDKAKSVVWDIYFELKNNDKHMEFSASSVKDIIKLSSSDIYVASLHMEILFYLFGFDNVKWILDYPMGKFRVVEQSSKALRKEM